MKTSPPLPWRHVALAALLLLAGCNTTPTAQSGTPATATGPGGPAAPDAKPKVYTWLRFLDRDDVRAYANDGSHPQLRERLLFVDRDLAKAPEVRSAGAAPLLVMLAGYATEALVKWIGGEVGDAMAAHTAQISATGDTSWWSGTGPKFVAVELRRDRFGPGPAENQLDVIVLLQPSPGADRPCFRLVPVYWKESKSEATVWGDTLAASLTVTITGAWVDADGDPTNASLVTWSWPVPAYKLDETRFTDVPAAAGAAADGHLETIPGHPDYVVKGTTPSAYIALPIQPALLRVTFQIAESDQNWFARHLSGLGKAISDQAGAAKTAVTNHLGN